LGDFSVLVETLTFPLDQDGNLPDIFEERFSKIVRLLSSQKDPDFRVLHCLKYSSQISETSARVRLISQIPDSETTPTIRTLADIYRGIKSDQRPSLGLRFSMCHQLAESLFLLHSVDWVHRALRSDNVLIILPNDDLDRAALKLAELRICGFEASRPVTDSSLGPYDNQLSRNVYRHPKRWGTPRELFTQVHDVYSLGVILLEIGLWERAEDMISSLKPEQRVPEPVSQYLLRHANERLVHRCGDVFADAVRKCLTLNFDEDSDEASIASLTELQRQQKIHRGLLEHVIDPLKVLKDTV
jgi:serine/threonine protein kinase